MARRKKSGGGGEEGPAWLVTFSDLMTLLLTFFVLLLSMATIDERSKLEVLGSLSKQFGLGTNIPSPLSTVNKASINEPGPMEMAGQDMDPLRDMIYDDANNDLKFQENKYVQIFSVNSEVLFKPGGFTLTEQGIVLLDRMLPYLRKIEYPLLVAGHTAPRMDEEGSGYAADMDQTKTDSTWMLSFHRAEAVYRHFTERGIPPSRLSMEAFGQFHPRFGNSTPEGRKQNRRVDLVLDKRNLVWIRKMENLTRTAPEEVNTHYYKGFRFDLTMPGENRRIGR